MGSIYFHSPTNALLLNLKQSKIYIKTLLHVKIIRSSSGSLHCAWLKLFTKIISKLCRCSNMVMWQHVMQLHVRSTSGIVTLCRWPSGAQVERGLSPPDDEHNSARNV
jgi:hypothetical protein